MSKIPKYILKALEQRKKYANEFVKYDSIVSNFCQKNNIETEYVNLHVGCVCEPDVAYIYTLEAIEKSMNS
jgi:hypothetical protein